MIELVVAVAGMVAVAADTVVVVVVTDTVMEADMEALVREVEPAPHHRNQVPTLFSCQQPFQHKPDRCLRFRNQYRYGDVLLHNRHIWYMHLDLDASIVMMLGNTYDHCRGSGIQTG